jgi:hypothetical protein
VLLRWRDNSTGEDGFHVERAPKPRKGSLPQYVRVGQAPAGAIRWSETVTSGTYLYRVQAFSLSRGVLSPYSNEVQVRVGR